LSRKHNKVGVGGNIGDPISGMAAGLDREWILVIEVSSFQLDTILSFRPEVSVLLNITPDHLDRYPSYDAYVQSKARLFQNQAEPDVAIINRDDQDCQRASADAKCRILPFSVQDTLQEGAFIKDQSVVVRVGGREESILLTQDLRIRGPHNLANTLAASLAATVLGCEPDLIGDTLRGFEGLEHRLEYVADVRGVDFINDSKATNADSMRWALEAISSPVILIAGGHDKGSDFGQVIPLVGEKVRKVFLLGEARRTLERAFSDVVEVDFAESLEEAVELAYRWSRPGDAVLLSPGCASYDMFRDFEHRGRVFKQAVVGLSKEYGANGDG
jgi:UDP-N-acetylmuramoylalanine--D-glutamate ligase